MQSTHTVKLSAAHHMEPAMPPDRLPMRLAAPVVLALSVLCWIGVWQLARIIF